MALHPRSASRYSEIDGSTSIETLAKTASELRERFGDQTLWVVSSRGSGGGVAEMLHSLLPYARGFGVDVRWLVQWASPEAARVHRRLHDALHGDPGDGSDLGRDARACYEAVAARNMEQLAGEVRPGDVVFLHDPPTVGLIPGLVKRGARVVWRCHIGSDVPGIETDRGWGFLAPYLGQAHAFVFSRFSYLPDFCDRLKSAIVAPSIDPFSTKNQDLTDTTVRDILRQVGLLAGPEPAHPPVFLRRDGTKGYVRRRADVIREQGAPGLATPMIVQVSRWDRLKDPRGVLGGFSRLLDSAGSGAAELVLAGPAPVGTVSEPEAREVFDEVVAAWRSLSSGRRRAIHLAALPVVDREENAAIVNALQRHATIVVQKSLREGFGLTVAEAMWKARPVVASAVGGIQDQIEHGVSGWLLSDPTDQDAFASALRQLLERRGFAERLGRNARRRVSQHFLAMRSLTQYLDLFGRLLD